MSFSSDTKEELIRLPLGKACCMLHELGAITQTSASLSIQGGGQVAVTFRLESAALARRVFMLLRGRLGVTPTLHFVQHPRLGGQRTAVLTLRAEDARRLLTALHMMEEKSDGSFRVERMAPRHNTTRQCCRRAFLRGAFLGAGSVTNPEKGYHFEFVAMKPDFEKSLLEMLKKSGISGKVALRKGNRVVYLKDSNQIADLLGLMGAHKSLMTMEEVRVQKDVLNRINRVMNCDQHNMEKQLDASQAQQEAIRYLARVKGLNTLPPALQAVARARLSHPDATLQQLGESMDPPVGKSGINHRLRKIVSMAQAYREQEEETL